MSGTIEAISNGLGSQSMYLLLLASRGEIPATVSITADTGAERDCLWNTGRRSTAFEFWSDAVVPFCEKHRLGFSFTRAVDKHKRELPDLDEFVRDMVVKGKMRGVNIPMFGSQGGRLSQFCTDKWKVRAIRQRARLLGAKHLICAQGIHAGEIGRRASGRVVGKHGEYTLYQDVIVRRNKKTKEKISTDVKWCQHYYPMADRMLGRLQAVEALEMVGLPYLVSSQCDFCPHKDLPRWERTSQSVLLQIAALEDTMEGKQFFTSERIPLLDALERMRRKSAPMLDTNFGCENDHCGI